MKKLQKGINSNRLLAGASLLVAIALTATPVFAQQAAEGVSPAPASGDTDEGTEIVVKGHFLNSGASSATKLDIPVLDTPFSVSAYNNNFLKAIETTSVSDLYRYMTGVQRAGNTGYDITLRGFKSAAADRNAIMTDGLPGLSVRFGSPPTVGIDHIEVVKGPTSVLYGQAQPGGFINMITKKPRSQPGYEISLKGSTGIGPFNRARSITGSIDATGPIDKNGTLLYRIVAEVADSKGFRDFSYEHPIYVAPSLTWNIGPDTSLTLAGEYRKVRTHYDTYLVAPNRDATLIPAITTSYQEPTDYLIENGKIGNVSFSHRFSGALKFNAAYRYVDHFDAAFGFDSVGFRNTTPTTLLTTLTRRARGQENKRTYGFLDANIVADFDTFGIEHKLIFGGTIGKETSNFNRTQFYNAPATGALSLDVDIYNPLRNAQPLSAYPLCNTGTGLTVAICTAAGSALTWRDTTLKSKGAYISDLITLHKMFKVMLGLRYAVEDQDIVELRVPGVPEQVKHDTKWLPLAGLIFQPTENVSIYGSYSSSFVPVAAGAFDNFGLNPFNPTSANSIEGGVKAELFDKRLTITAAYFDIKKKDTLNTFTCLTAAQLAAAGIAIPTGATIATGTCSAQIGGERSKGFELEVSANPIEGLSIAAGYAHTQARVTDSNIAIQVGSRLTNSPDDAFNIWTRYDVQNGPLKGLGVGLGVAYIGDRTSFLPTFQAVATTGTATAIAASQAAHDLALKTMPLASYTVVDLGVYYKVSDGIDLTFKVSNLFDKRYIESAGFTADINLVPGAPRLATFSARFKF